MAASSSDVFKKSKSLFSTTLSAGVNDSTTTIPLNSVSGLPTDTGVTLTIDRVDTNGTVLSTKERITGTVSGSSIINATRGDDSTTAQAHSSGAIVEAIWDGSQLNDIITGLTAEHSQLDGTHTTITATSIASKTAATDLTISGNTTGLVKINAQYGAITADTDAATVTFDMSVTNRHGVTLGGNRTLAVSNVKAGQVFLIRLLQDATGSRTVTWFSTITWATGTTPTLTTTASKADSFIFYAKTSTTFDGFIVGQNI